MNVLLKSSRTLLQLDSTHVAKATRLQLGGGSGSSLSTLRRSNWNDSPKIWIGKKNIIMGKKWEIVIARPFASEREQEIKLRFYKSQGSWTSKLKVVAYILLCAAFAILQMAVNEAWWGQSNEEKIKQYRENFDAGDFSVMFLPFLDASHQLLFDAGIIEEAIYAISTGKAKDQEALENYYSMVESMTGFANEDILKELVSKFEPSALLLPKDHPMSQAAAKLLCGYTIVDEGLDRLIATGKLMSWIMQRLNVNNSEHEAAWWILARLSSTNSGRAFIEKDIRKLLEHAFDVLKHDGWYSGFGVSYATNTHYARVFLSNLGGNTTKRPIQLTDKQYELLKEQKKVAPALSMFTSNTILQVLVTAPIALGWGYFRTRRAISRGRIVNPRDNEAMIGGIKAVLGCVFLQVAGDLSSLYWYKMKQANTQDTDKQYTDTFTMAWSQFVIASVAGKFLPYCFVPMIITTLPSMTGSVNTRSFPYYFKL